MSTNVSTNGKKKYDPLVEGRYKVELDNLNLRQSENVEGCLMVEPTFKVVEGANAGRLIFERFIVSHPSSEKAVEIGKEKIDKFIKATGDSKGLGAIGEDGFGNLLMYKGKQVVATVKIEDGNNGYSARNKITNFLMA